MSIPEYLVNKLYDQSLLWSDYKKSCLFPRDLKTGVFLRWTLPGKAFKMTTKTNGRAYVIPGDGLIIITEAPIDAISLKYYYQTATILATGGRSVKGNLWQIFLSFIFSIFKITKEMNNIV
jgi:hypothetical protein